ncbi:MAG: U32 family peptidase [Clostridia bacterium]|nr:U32 family peptidase [Clostridia bacterium]
MMENKNPNLPELLAPASDMDALKSAIANGADAVYFGTDLFNARMRAHNFSLDDARTAIRLCHAHNVKAFVTLNIEIYDREIPTVLEYVSALYEAGVDALIVADFGIIALLREHFPDLEIHASTQASAHNLDGVNALSALGCKRVVVARELDEEGIKYICDNTDTEIEMFVHGAHCMSMSGQCLMSYAMGGRSGNRGECAQPCRLPYTMECGVRSAECGMWGAECGMRISDSPRTRAISEVLNEYPLSLKDMSLAQKIPQILDTGVDSLKIEGRMKSAEYVGGVVSIWRGLLDARRGAGKAQMQRLERLFSRQGFTSGYFDRQISDEMLGIRSESDKSATREQGVTLDELKKPQIDIFARFMIGERAMLTITLNGKSVSVYGDIVERAINAPMTDADIIKSLSKLGATPFSVGKIELERDDNIIIRVSSLNALRREAIDAILGARAPKRVDYVSKKRPMGNQKLRTAVFGDNGQIPQNATEFFDRIYIPAHLYDSEHGANGVYLPPIILDRDWNELAPILEGARERGAKYALITNLGQLKIVKEMGFIVACDFRFNAFNHHTVEYLYSLGVENVILSPELSLPQSRDLGDCSLIVYGKFPVMTTFKCICGGYGNCTGQCKGYLTDRTGAKMFYEGVYGHHTVIYNSVPIYMADKGEAINSFSWHFIFSDEPQQECESIIEAYKRGTPTTQKIRRIAK